MKKCKNCGGYGIYTNSDGLCHGCLAERAAGEEKAAQISTAGDEKAVRIPTSEDEAAAMVLLGMDYLKRYAPHRLTEQGKLYTVNGYKGETVGSIGPTLVDTGAMIKDLLASERQHDLSRTDDSGDPERPETNNPILERRMTMPISEPGLQAALAGLADILKAPEIGCSRVLQLRDFISGTLCASSEGQFDEASAENLADKVVQALFGVCVEKEQDLKARIAALEEQVKRFTEDNQRKQLLAKESTPPFSVGELLESKQGTIRGILVVTRVYICDDDEGHPLWFADVVQIANGVSYKKVYCDLLQRVSR
jgi:hypothetical protein